MSPGAVCLLSAHDIERSPSGEAHHLLLLADTLRREGRAVTVVTGPVDLTQTFVNRLAAAKWEEHVDRVVAEVEPAAVVLWTHLDLTDTLLRRWRWPGVKVLEQPAADLTASPASLAWADTVVVPSAWAARELQSSTAEELRVVTINPLIRSVDVARPPARPPVRATFVNPEPAKGLWVVYQLAGLIDSLRLPLRIRVVEGRWTCSDAARYGLDLTRFACVQRVPYAPDLAHVLSDTDVILMPSLWRESYGMVAREAVAHGIPVVASDAGGLPEAVGTGGVCLPTPLTGADFEVRMTAPELRRWLRELITTAGRQRESDFPTHRQHNAESLRRYERVLSGVEQAAQA